MAKRSTKQVPGEFRYLNPWSSDPVTKPEYFVTTVKPIEYRGFQIVHRFSNSHELVKDGVCLTIRAGKGGPKSLADALCGDKNDEPKWLILRAINIAAAHGVKLPARRRAA